MDDGELKRERDRKRELDRRRDEIELECTERLRRLLNLEVRRRDEQIEAEMLLDILRENNRARDVACRNDEVRMRNMELERQLCEMGVLAEAGRS